MAHLHHDHGHDHGGHDDVDGGLTSDTTQRILVALVAVMGLVAVVGLFVLRPEADRPILADELGMGSELVDATVTAVEDVSCFGMDEGLGIRCEEITFDVTSGSPAGEEGWFQIAVSPVMVHLEVGDRISVGYEPGVEEHVRYYFNDYQRRTPLALLAGLFAVAVIALGRWQGVRALIGLVITGVVMVGFLFPSVLDGNNPTAVAIVASLVIALTALYLTHGITERTTVALLGTFAALGVTAVLAAAFSSLARFTGFGVEDAAYLQAASQAVDIRGLLLAGIIIGSLGVLDDVTITQVSAVWQIHKANPAYGVRELYRAGVTIGRDHIASTVNTLVLAYAGASLPLLLVFTQAGRSLGDVVNGELVAVEVVRTLVGSIGLITAVPVTTALAAWVITKGSRAPAPPDAGEGPGPDPDPDPRGDAAPVPVGREDPAAVEPEGGDDGDEGWDDFAPPAEPPHL